MISTTEETVTKILSSKEILNMNKAPKFVSNPKYNLGGFLSDYIPEPSPYEEKYIFIK